MSSRHCLTLLLLLCAAIIHAGESATFSNPLLPSGADPWITHDDGMWYYMTTHDDRLAIRKTRDLTQLAQAPETTVWRPPAHGSNAQSIWAPELHRIDGIWYIYYSATASGPNEDAYRSVFVLENPGHDPTEGTWIDHGRLRTRWPGIDGTTFAHAGQRYFVYSPYVGPDSVLSITAMADPVTLTGEETIIARPDQEWERQGGRQILEGPQFLAGPNGELFLSYSGSACWSDGYAIGLLKAPAGSDPLDAAAWVKRPQPILATDAQQSVYGPGHNSFFSSPDGSETWIAYHANPEAGMRCGAGRSLHIQRVHWTDEGEPWIGPPAGPNVVLTAPAGNAPPPESH